MAAEAHAPLCALSTEALAPAALWPPATIQLHSAATQPQDGQTSRGCRLQALVK